MVALRVPQAAAVDLQPHIWQQVKSQPSLDFQGVWWKTIKKEERGKMQSSEQSGKIWQWEISWVQIWGNRKSLFYFVLKPKPQTSTLWIVAIWLSNESSLQSCQDDKGVYLVHCNRYERCHLPQPCPSRPQGKLLLLRTCKSKGVVNARSTLVIWVQNSIIFCFSSKLRHFLEKSLEDTVASWSWLAGSQIWLILNGLLETRERVIDFCKTGEEGFPSKSLLSKHTLGCLQIKGDFTVRWCLLSNMQITFNNQPTNPSSSSSFNSVPLSTPEQSKAHQCVWRNCNIVPF